MTCLNTHELIKKNLLLVVVMMSCVPACTIDVFDMDEEDAPLLPDVFIVCMQAEDGPNADVHTSFCDTVAQDIWIS
jgi:hypothetical protein